MFEWVGRFGRELPRTMVCALLLVGSSCGGGETPAVDSDLLRAGGVAECDWVAKQELRCTAGGVSGAGGSCLAQLFADEGYAEAAARCSAEKLDGRSTTQVICDPACSGQISDCCPGRRR
jgi:hypothetical protein